MSPYNNTLQGFAQVCGEENYKYEVLKHVLNWRFLQCFELAGFYIFMLYRSQPCCGTNIRAIMPQDFLKEFDQ